MQELAGNSSRNQRMLRNSITADIQKFKRLPREKEYTVGLELRASNSMKRLNFEENDALIMAIRIICSLGRPHLPRPSTLQAICADT
ncbi:unnamed protein product [Victoria cruziana]